MQIIFNLIKICGGLILLILVILVSEWIYSEIRFQAWLGQDKRRLDFSAYHTTIELKRAIFAKLPLGSTEDEIQAFMITNGDIQQEPDIVADNIFGVVMKMDQSGRGFFRLIASGLVTGVWIIIFHLDPEDHTLVDITIKAFAEGL